ncbi:MAG: hydrogenase maturation protease [Chloroflexota bacterium]
MKTIVVGLGNPILTDDGVGVKIACAVEDELAKSQPENITVTEAGVGGLRLMETLLGYDRAIIIDAIKFPKGSKPGAIHRLSIEDLRTIHPTQHTASAHDTTLVTALDMGRQMGLRLPKDIVIFAVEVENVLEFSEDLTPSVLAALPQATEMVMKEISKI